MTGGTTPTQPERAAERLSRCLPAGEPCETFNCDTIAIWGVTKDEAENLIGWDCKPCFLAVIDRCPRFDAILSEPDNFDTCCGGECQGDPLWTFVQEGHEGAVPGWRSTDE